MTMNPPEHYDAIVVGSGFGGSTMAAELAEAGLRVCVLERGRRYPPGSFARSPREMSRNFWDPRSGLYGMFDVWSFQHSEAIVSSGLGGGSLIYANVLLRKPEEWFSEQQPDGTLKPWPVSRQDLDPHYDAVEQAMGATQYPFGESPYRDTRKTRAFHEAAETLGYDWFLPKLAITFASRPECPPVPGESIDQSVPNLHGASRRTCTLCGECDIGCNTGSKNTLDFTYLSRAARAGAVIMDSCEVKTIRPRISHPRGYEVEFIKYQPDAWDGRKMDLDAVPRQKLTTDRLILSAGTLGSTFLLLRNRENFPNLSKCLGSRYSTNGDLLSFAVCCSGGKGGIPKRIEASRGPVITSSISAPVGKHGGFFLQDAGYPMFLDWMAEMADAPGWLRRVFKFAWHRIVEWLGGEPNSEVDKQVSALLGTGGLSSSSMPILGMGRDTADGTMMLRRARRSQRELLQVNWSDAGSKEYFKTITKASRKVAESMGGKFMQNAATEYLHRLVTVHPLGGCPMGNSAEDGVVDSYGEVFYYPGLYVADGAVMPGPVGANPSLTIAALARRFAHRILERHAEERT